jgi:hypothetical protein
LSSIARKLDSFFLAAAPRSQAADDLVRHLGRAEGLLEHARLRVDAVEDGDLPQVGSRRGRALDALDDERRLVALVARRHDADCLARLVGRPQLLGLALVRPRDDPESRRDDARTRSVVLLELHDRRAGVVAPETADVAHVRAAPAVDALIVVADDAQVVVPAHELPQEPVLRRVRVLELVDEHIVEAAADAVGLCTDAALHASLLEELPHEQNQVLEVDGVGGAEALLVCPEDAQRDVVDVRMGCRVVRAAPLLLVLVNVRQHCARGVAPFVEVERFEGA